MTYAVSFMPTARGDYRLPIASHVLRSIDSSRGGRLAKLRLSQCQMCSICEHGNFQRASLVPRLLLLLPLSAACWSCPDASITRTPLRCPHFSSPLRRFANFLFDFKHLHKTQSILLRSFRLPVQSNPIWFAIRFVIFEKSKTQNIYMYILKYKIFG